MRTQNQEAQIDQNEILRNLMNRLIELVNNDNYYSAELCLFEIKKDLKNVSNFEKYKPYITYCEAKFDVHSGHYEDAIKAFTTLITSLTDKNDFYVTVQVNRAKVYQLLGNYQAAMNDIEKVSELNLSNNQTAVNKELANILFKLGRNDESYQIYKNLSQNLGGYNVYKRLAKLSKDKKEVDHYNEEQLSILEVSLDQRPAYSFENFYTLGTLYLKGTQKDYPKNIQQSLLHFAYLLSMEGMDFSFKFLNKIETRLKTIASEINIKDDVLIEIKSTFPPNQPLYLRGPLLKEKEGLLNICNYLFDKFRESSDINFVQSNKSCSELAEEFFQRKSFDRIEFRLINELESFADKKDKILKVSSAYRFKEFFLEKKDFIKKCFVENRINKIDKISLCQEDIWNVGELEEFLKMLSEISVNIYEINFVKSLFFDHQIRPATTDRIEKIVPLFKRGNFKSINLSYCLYSLNFNEVESLFAHLEAGKLFGLNLSENKINDDVVLEIVKKIAMTSLKSFSLNRNGVRFNIKAVLEALYDSVCKNKNLQYVQLKSNSINPEEHADIITKIKAQIIDNKLKDSSSYSLSQLCQFTLLKKVSSEYRKPVKRDHLNELINETDTNILAFK